MNLDLSALGIVHTAASLLAILAGLLVLLLPKGSAAHRWRGRTYLLTMLVTNLTALGIYSQGTFGLGHWLTVLNLAVLLTGFAAVRRRWPGRGWTQVHAGAMAISFFLLLFAGVGELFQRLPVLNDLAAELDLPLLPATLLLLLAVTVASLVYLLAVTARRFAAGP